MGRGPSTSMERDSSASMETILGSKMVGFSSTSFQVNFHVIIKHFQGKSRNSRWEIFGKGSRRMGVHITWPLEEEVGVEERMEEDLGKKYDNLKKLNQKFILSTFYSIGAIKETNLGST